MLSGTLFAAALAAVTATSHFDLDGNPGVAGVGAYDWADLYADKTTTPFEGEIGTFGTPVLSEVGVDPADPDWKTRSIFTTGGSKDTGPLGGWKFTDGSVPNKNNILNGAVGAVKASNGETFMYFMMDRLAATGDFQTGVWLLQDQVTQESGTSGNFQGTGSAGEAVHKEGDLLIVISFDDVNSGSADVYKWFESGTPVDVDGNDCSVPGPCKIVAAIQDADCTDGFVGCFRSNTASAAAPWPLKDAQGNAVSDYEAFSFFEGAINLNQVVLNAPGATGAETIPCFNAAVLESRSSSSIGAQLKDFIFAPIASCPLQCEGGCPTNPPNTAVVTDAVRAAKTKIGRCDAAVSKASQSTCTPTDTDLCLYDDAEETPDLPGCDAASSCFDCPEGATAENTCYCADFRSFVYADGVTAPDGTTGTGMAPIGNRGAMAPAAILGYTIHIHPNAPQSLSSLSSFYLETCDFRAYEQFELASEGSTKDSSFKVPTCASDADEWDQNFCCAGKGKDPVGKVTCPKGNNDAPWTKVDIFGLRTTVTQKSLETVSSKDYAFYFSADYQPPGFDEDGYVALKTGGNEQVYGQLRIPGACRPPPNGGPADVTSSALARASTEAGNAVNGEAAATTGTPTFVIAIIVVVVIVIIAVAVAIAVCVFCNKSKRAVTTEAQMADIKTVPDFYNHNDQTDDVLQSPDLSDASPVHQPGGIFAGAASE